MKPIVVPQLLLESDLDGLLSRFIEANIKSNLKGGTMLSLQRVNNSCEIL